MNATKRIEEYKAKLDVFVEQYKAIMSNNLAESPRKIEDILLIPFTNVEPFEGDTKNLIFFTYSDAYKGNDPTFMSANRLIEKPHSEEDDRGYIKGVATDLDGYLKLRALPIGFNEMNVPNIPHFGTSKNKPEYLFVCAKLRGDAVNELFDFAKQCNDYVNVLLKERTGCSLLHYLRQI